MPHAFAVPQPVVSYVLLAATEAGARAVVGASLRASADMAPLEALRANAAFVWREATRRPDLWSPPEATARRVDATCLALARKAAAH
ncbi:hypothetical protein JL722_12100 [Aureococcus anophagefferens]|nr:hypothetical protein JL722_12100 [Aureococcus anophagefferens]